MPREPVLLLLDRDGTLMEDVGYPNDPAMVRLLPGAAEAIRELASQNFVPAVVSNQSGIARGWITPIEAAAVHERFVDLMESSSGARVTCFYCPHGPEDACRCRKPEPGLLEEAAHKLGMVGKPCVMIGDKLSDVEAGKRVKAMTILYGKPTDNAVADFVSNEWDEIIEWLKFQEVFE